MQRKSAQARRVEVLAETLKQIRLHGMSSMKISDVASGLEVSPALILYHFETRENLVVEALRHAAERDLLKLRRIMREASGPTDGLMRALQWYSPTGQARGWQIWVDAWGAAMRDAVLGEVLVGLQRQWTEQIVEVIDEGVAQGMFSTESSVDVATRITSFLDGLAVRIVVHHDALDQQTLDEWLVGQVVAELGVSREVLVATMG